MVELSWCSAFVPLPFGFAPPPLPPPPGLLNIKHHHIRYTTPTSSQFFFNPGLFPCPLSLFCPFHISHTLLLDAFDAARLHSPLLIFPTFHKA